MLYKEVARSVFGEWFAGRPSWTNLLSQEVQGAGSVDSRGRTSRTKKSGVSIVALGL